MDVTTLTRFVQGLPRDVDVSTNTIQMDSIKVGDTTPTELTQEMVALLVTIDATGLPADNLSSEAKEATLQSKLAAIRTRVSAFTPTLGMSSDSVTTVVLDAATTDTPVTGLIKDATTKGIFVGTVANAGDIGRVLIRLSGTDNGVDDGTGGEVYGILSESSSSYTLSYLTSAGTPYSILAENVSAKLDFFFVEISDLAGFSVESLLSASLGGAIDSTHASAVYSETSARLEADSSLQGLIDQEATSRSDADDFEITARSNADSTLQAQIQVEITARQDADSSIVSLVSEEPSDREAADSSLQSNLDSELTSRSDADSSIQGLIDIESGDRSDGDAFLRYTALDLETTNRIDADTLIIISDSERIAADSSLTANIDSEISSRLNTDSNLAVNISEGGASEAISRELADVAVYNTLDPVGREIADSSLTNNISFEVTARQDADSSIQATLSDFSDADSTLLAELASGFSALGTNDVNTTVEDYVLTAYDEVNSILYAGGGFSLFGGISSNYVVKYQSGSWSAVSGGETIGPVSAMAIDPVTGYLYVAHNYTISKWNGSTWANIGLTNYGINCLKYISSYLYIGGSFTTVAKSLGVGQINAGCVARFNGTDWQALGTEPSGLPGVNQPVMTITALGTDIYVGGEFELAGNSTALGIAKWAPSTGKWSNVAGGVMGTVTDSAVVGSNLYLIGASTIQLGRYITTGSGSGSNYTWTTRMAAGARAWYAIASSSDGTKIVAAARVMAWGDDYIFTSTDSGATWTEQRNSGLRNWTAVTSSADGAKLAATSPSLGVTAGYIYTSTDSGVTWTQRATAQQWRDIAGSKDGTKLIALWGVVGGAYSGYLYQSTDSGVTWSATTSAGSHAWTQVKISDDGSIIVAVYDGTGGFGNTNGTVLVSTNSGSTWTQVVASACRTVACSGDGLKIYYSDASWMYYSTNYGTSWTKYTSVSIEAGILTANYDGTTLIAVSRADPRMLIKSKDSGSNWSTDYSSLLPYPSIRDIALSSDGSEIALATDIYASISTNGIAKFNGTEWSNINPNSFAFANCKLAVNGTDLYVGGYTNEGGGLYVWGLQRSILKFDTRQFYENWSVPYIDVFLSGSLGWVTSMATDSVNNLYVGGKFSNACGTPATAIARYDLTVQMTSYPLSVTRLVADGDLAYGLSVESGAMADGDIGVSQYLDLEIQGSGDGDSGIAGAAWILSTAREEADSSLTSILFNIANADRAISDEALTISIMDASLARENTDSSILNSMTFDVSVSRLDADILLDNDIQGEIGQRENIDTYVLTSAIGDESTAREAADSTLALNVEVADGFRLSDDSTLLANIGIETAAREFSDSSLVTSIDSEISSRLSGDSTLSTNLNLEITARLNADSTLLQAINYINSMVVDAPYTAGESISAGNVVIESQVTAGKVLKANASALATCETIIGVAVQTKSADDLIMIRTYGEATVTTDGTNFDLGKRVYAHTVDGQASKTAPSVLDNVVYLLGSATATNKVFVNPSLDYVIE